MKRKRWMVTFKGGSMARAAVMRFATEEEAVRSAFWLRRLGCETGKPVRK